MLPIRIRTGTLSKIRQSVAPWRRVARPGAAAACRHAGAMRRSDLALAALVLVVCIEIGLGLVRDPGEVFIVVSGRAP